MEGTPGTFEIYADVPLATQQGQNLPPQEFTKATTATLTVTVPPPDKVTLPKPVNANWNLLVNGQNQPVGLITDVIPLGFPVTCQGNAPNLLPNATLLEDLTDIFFFGVHLRDKKNVPITLGGIQGVTLTDKKFLSIGQKTPQLFQKFFVAGGYPPGYVFTTYNQTLKLQIPDYNGDARIYPLGPTFTFTQTSTNGNATPTTITVQ